MRADRIVLVSVILAGLFMIPGVRAGGANGDRSVVVFTVAIDLPPASSGLTSMPLPILKRLSEEETPETIRMSQAAMGSMLMAEFRFSALTDSLEWYGSQETGELLAAFGEASSSGVETRLELSRTRGEEISGE